ncbi:adenylate kinase [Bacillus phage CAM003]|uniref:Adenylate kinase n=3 Tax=Bastillevirus TaxID=1918010 RepID=A0A024B1B1_9CAUD|nr:adenylate kinase [Bacillus phage Evoli]YP_009036950.1 adenylate kinase [Bacillus phage CAM003]AHZ09484.1 adenylate kinase [Bacillus phage CAM003]AHZ09773.1 adenylate kinase [Bacillus phage Evoli]AMW61801.1 dephospho-CoA kinase [Bacillus phage Vinny]
MIKIAIAGKMRAGKSIVERYLSIKYGFYIYDLSDGVKDDFAKKYPYNRGEKPRKGYKLYAELQKFAFGEDYWVRRTLNRIGDDVEQYESNPFTSREFFRNLPHFKVVVTGVRQENEFRALRESGYTIIRINADDKVRLQRIKDAGDICDMDDFTDETEQYVDKAEVDFDVYNNGELSSLYRQIDNIVLEIIERELKSNEN